MLKSSFASSSVMRWLLASTSVGLLVASSLHSPWAALPGLLCLAPLWIACTRASFFEAGVLGAATGLSCGLVRSVWVPGALRSLGSVDSETVAGLIGVAAWGGVPVVAAWAAVAWAASGLALPARCLVLAVGVASVEGLISNVWWGVPWGLLGYSQLDVPGVAQLAVVGGVPLVSALLAAFSAATAALLAGDRASLRLVAAIGAGWLSLVALGNPVAEGFRGAATGAGSVEFVFLQPDLPRGDRWVEALQPLNLHRVRLHAGRIWDEHSHEVDALVLPENFLTAPLDRAPELAAELEAWVDELGVPVLTGAVFSASRADSPHYRSSVVWIEPGAGITARLDKERAIPLLESARRFPGDSLLRSWIGAATRSPLVEESALQQGPLRGPFTVSPVLCYEILFPAISARRRSDDSLAILNMADDSWAPSDAVSRHLTRVARFRAIEQRIPVVRLAHGGLSSAIDPLGRVVETLPMDEYAAMRLELMPHNPPSLYERLTIAGLPIGGFAVVWWAWGLWGPARLGGGRP